MQVQISNRSNLHIVTTGLGMHSLPLTRNLPSTGFQRHASSEWEVVTPPPPVSTDTHLYSGDFSINVPRNIESVSVETGGGGVTTSHLGGRVDIETGGGQLRVEDVKGAVHAQTGGDNVEIASVGDLNLQTGGGRVSLRDIRGTMNASTGGGDVLLISSEKGGVLETGGGNIQVQQCGGKLKVSTGGGNIDIGDVVGAIEIETGGGSIRVGSAKGFVRAETGAGRIELNGIPGGQAETGSGTIVAKLISMQGGYQATTLRRARAMWWSISTLRCISASGQRLIWPMATRFPPIFRRSKL